ncbi:MAG: phenylalanine--tRNA ligase subunit beta, partial [Candidatus Adiutrix sp.]|nr:phenylalanine--tRNA ligase subunit beta [Candidatus Adiutrix sp.]
IGLKLEETDGRFQATLPSWRPDLTREVDVWEEVARLLDFDKLPATLPLPPIRRQAPPPAWRLREEARDHLTFRGFSETIAYSFLNPNFADKLGLGPDSPWRARLLPILNPLSQDQGVMRSLLAPGLLTALKLNQNHGRREATLFEVGVTFLSNGLNRQPEEKQTIAGLWAGLVGSGRWNDQERPVDFWDIKGVVEGLAEHFNLEVSFSRAEDLPPWYSPSEAAFVNLEGGRRLGHLGRLNRKAVKAFGLKDSLGAVYLFELDGDEILARGLTRPPFKHWSKFPQVERDMALVLDKNIPAAEVSAVIKAEKGLPLTGVFIFDLYEGDQLPEGKKSLAFRLTFQDEERTLTDEEVNRHFNVITEKMNSRFDATLRS